MATIGGHGGKGKKPEGVKPADTAADKKRKAEEAKKDAAAQKFNEEHGVGQKDGEKK